MSQKIDITKKCGLIGAGIGLALFAVFGLLEGAMIGGTAGIGIVNYIFGQGTLEIMGGELMPRIMIAASMLAGVMVSCIAFVVAGSVVGAAGGYVLAVSIGASEAAEGMAVTEAAGSKKG